MPRHGNKLTSKRGIIFSGILMLVGLSACEAIGGPEYPVLNVETAQKQAQRSPQIVVTNESEKSVPKAPDASSQSYKSGYDDVWKENQSVQELIVAELTRQEGASEPKEMDGFGGQTYSLLETSPPPPLEPAAPAPEYFKIDEHHSDDHNEEGHYAVHLASYRIEENARKGWHQLQKKHHSISNKQARLHDVDLPNKGPFKRLLAGPYSSKDEAQAACGELKAHGQYCAVMVYEGHAL